MKRYEVLYETPKSQYWTEHSYTDQVDANSLENAISTSLENQVKKGKLVLTGIDLADSFHGLDRDYYEIGSKSPEEFKAEIRKFIIGVKQVC